MSSSANDLSNNYLENGSMPVKWAINENGDKYKLFVNMIRAHCSQREEKRLEKRRKREEMIPIRKQRHHLHFLC